MQPSRPFCQNERSIAQEGLDTSEPEAVATGQKLNCSDAVLLGMGLE
jgi:hypothetical protein